MSEEYKPPLGSEIGANFTDPFTKAKTNFTRDGDTPVGDTQYVTVFGSEYTQYGSSTVWNYHRWIKPTGVNHAEYGKPTLHNAATALSLAGINHAEYGNPIIWNLKQVLLVKSVEPIPILDRIPTPNVANWIHHVSPPSINISVIGTPTVINTHATQRLVFTGVNHAEYGRPTLRNSDAYRVYPNPIDSSAIGVPRALYYDVNVEFTDFFESGTPTLRQRITMVGLSDTRYGTAFVENADRTITMSGKDHTEYGRPTVTDPTQWVEMSSVRDSAIMGDRHVVWNFNLHIQPRGDEMSLYGTRATVESNKRELGQRGLSHLEIGRFEIRNGTPNFTPVGVDHTQYGAPFISYKERIVKFAFFGITSQLTFGSPTLRNLTQEIITKGDVHTLFGNNIPTLFIREVQPFSFTEQTEYGEPSVELALRRVNMVGTTSTVISSSHDVTNQYRTVQMQGRSTTTMGLPWVDVAIKTVSVVGFSPSIYGKPSVQNNTQHVYMNGTQFTEFLTSISPRPYTAWVSAIRPVVIPNPNVFNRNRVVEMRGSLSSSLDQNGRWGYANKVFNSLQFVHFQDDLYNYGIDAYGASRDTVVREKNQYITPLTTSPHTRWGTSRLGLNARALLPKGLDTFVAPTTHMVADGIRYLNAQGVPPYVISRYTSVYNDAIQLYQQGTVHTEFGETTVTDLTQRIRVVSLDNLQVGQHWMSFAPRTIHPISIAPPYIPRIVVEQGSRRIEVKSVEYVAYPSGNSEVIERINRIKFTRGIDSYERSNGSVVHNVTPEVKLYGLPSFESGRYSIRTQWRHINMHGHQDGRMGLGDIRDNKQVILVTGRNTLVIGNTLITKGTPDPVIPVTTYIEPRGIFWNSEVARYGRATISDNGISEVGDINSFESGDIFVDCTVRVVEFRRGIGAPQLADGFGMVSNRHRVVSLDGGGMDYTIKVTDGGWPDRLRMSPHTIYCRPDVPDQTNESYANINSTWVNPWLETDSSGNRLADIGSPSIRNKLSPPDKMPQDITCGDTFVTGQATLANAGGRIEFTGINSLRIGWSKILPHEQSVDQYDSSQFTAYGNARVVIGDRPTNREIKPTSIVGVVSSGHRVEFFNREVTPQGREMTLWGQRATNADKPYTWNGFAVSPPMPTIMVGKPPSNEYGEPWVDFRIRTVAPMGTDSFISEYSLEDFDKRMRVKEINRPERYPTQTVNVIGLNNRPNVSVPDVKLMRYYIRPDGWANQYHQGIGGTQYGEFEIST